MTREQLVCVFRAPVPLVNLLASLLRANDIACVVFDEHVANLHYGVFAARLMVAASDEDLARRVIEEAEPLAAES